MSFQPQSDARPSRTIFVLLFVIPIFSVLLYGSTDISALIPLSLLTGVLGGVWIVRTWRSGRLELNVDSAQLPLIGLILLGVIQLLPFGDPGLATDAITATPSSALTLDPFSTRIFLVRLVGYSVFFAAALTFIDSEGRYKKAVAAVVVFGGGLAFLGILQKLASPEAIYGMRKPSQAIPFGPYVNQHHFASLMVLLSGLAISHMLGGGVSRQVKLLIAISTALMAIAVPMTSSRGAMISYVAMISVSGLAWFYGRNEGGQRRQPWLLLGAGAAVATFVALGTVILLGGGDSLLRGVGLAQTSDDISSGRLHFWSVTWRIFTANPIIGAGLDAFGVAYTQFDTEGGLYRVEQAHNDYLQMLADGGIIAFALTIVFLVLVVRKGITRIRTEKNGFIRTTTIGCLAGCVGIFVHSLFDFPLRTAGNAYCFLLVIAIMLAPVASEMFKTNGRES